MSKVLPVPSGSETIAFKGKLIEVVHQKMQVGEKEFTLEFARRAPGTRLIIVSPDKKILLAKEYRTEIKGWDIRLPGGKVVDSLQEYNQIIKTGEDMLEKAQAAAKKEALEEVGLIVDDIKHIATSTCGATIIWDLYYFVVDKYHASSQGQKLELGENIISEWVSFTEAKELCLTGKVQEDRSAAVLLRFLAKNI
jgi:8-oxo-dGTP pyrophosphatase MutT (NUDIX family)